MKKRKIQKEVATVESSTAAPRNDIQLKIASTSKKYMNLSKKFKDLEEHYSKEKNKVLEVHSQLLKLKAEAEQQESIRSAEQTKSYWDRVFTWDNGVRNVLKENFHSKGLCANECAAVNAMLSLKDVFLVLPPGSEKSLTFQVASFFGDGFTLVITSSVQFIYEQLEICKKYDINARALVSGLEKEKRAEAYSYMQERKYDLRLLYISLDWMSLSKRFESLLKYCYKKGRLTRIVIDEFHCCSEWSHDSRAQYKPLLLLRKRFPTTPIIGLTTTITMSVLLDCKTQLNLNDVVIIRESTIPSNVFYAAVLKPSKNDEALNLLFLRLTRRYKNKQGIIIVKQLQENKTLVTDLRMLGIDVASYHSKLSALEKVALYHKWEGKKIQVIVAASASELALTKSTIRFIVHYKIPKSLDELYHETCIDHSVRLGECTVFFNMSDFFTLLTQASNSEDERKASMMLDYCFEERKCRRSLIANYFGDSYDVAHCREMCDNCNAINQDIYDCELYRAVFDVKSILKKAEECAEEITIPKLMRLWSENYKTQRCQKIDLSSEDVEFLVGVLYRHKVISVNKKFTTRNIAYYIEFDTDSGPISVTTRHNLKGFPKKKINGNDNLGEPSAKIQKVDTNIIFIDDDEDNDD